MSNLGNIGNLDLDPLGIGYDRTSGDGYGQERNFSMPLSAMAGMASNERYMSTAGYGANGGTGYLNMPSTSQNMGHLLRASRMGGSLSNSNDASSAAMMSHSHHLHDGRSTREMEQMLLASLNSNGASSAAGVAQPQLPTSRPPANRMEYLFPTSHMGGNVLNSNEAYSASPLMPPQLHRPYNNNNNNHSAMQLQGYGDYPSQPHSLSMLSRSYPALFRNSTQTSRFPTEAASAPPAPTTLPYQSSGLNADALVATRSFSTRHDFGTHDISPMSGPASNNNESPPQLNDNASAWTAQDQQQLLTVNTVQSRLSVQSDQTFLCLVHNFLRRYCIQFFVATEENMRANAPGRGARATSVGQVGLRCFFCKDKPVDKLTKQAVCFPSKRDTIFECVRNYHRTHLPVCPCIPDEMKAEYKRLTQQITRQKRSQKFTKAYYAEAASEVGIVDSPNGLVLGAPRNDSGVPSEKMQALIRAAENPSTSAAFWKAQSSGKDKAVEMRKFEHVASNDTKRVIVNARKESTPFVYPEDFATISDFEFLLFHQVVPLPCAPVNEPSHRKDEVLGFCCKHCVHAGEWTDGNSISKGSMHFPVNWNTLTEKNFLQKLLNHFMACPNTPREVKGAFGELKRLAMEHGTTAKRGSRRRFIMKIWDRMKRYYGRQST